MPSIPSQKGLTPLTTIAHSRSNLVQWPYNRTPQTNNSHFLNSRSRDQFSPIPGTQSPAAQFPPTQPPASQLPPTQSPAANSPVSQPPTPVTPKPGPTNTPQTLTAPSPEASAPQGNLSSDQSQARKAKKERTPKLRGKAHSAAELSATQKQVLSLLDQYGFPLLRQVGPPLARRFGPPIARRLAPPLTKYVGYPLLRRVGVPFIRKLGVFLLRKIF